MYLLTEYHQASVRFANSDKPAPGHNCGEEVGGQEVMKGLCQRSRRWLARGEEEGGTEEEGGKEGDAEKIAP